MNDSRQQELQFQCVSSFEDLVSFPYKDEINAICWKRNLIGDFSEVVKKIDFQENMLEISEEHLVNIELSKRGQLAREILLQDLHLLKELGASPILNLIRFYDRDDENPIFPLDVYSYHVDRSPIPTHTFLCTYFGAASEIIPNSQAIQKIHIPEIRAELKKMYDGSEDGFEDFLTENFFDLHYQAKPDAQLIDCGIGNLWKISVDYPSNNVLPCLHRAPLAKHGQTRLLLIC